MEIFSPTCILVNVLTGILFFPFCFLVELSNRSVGEKKSLSLCACVSRTENFIQGLKNRLKLSSSCNYASNAVSRDMNFKQFQYHHTCVSADVL